MKKLIFLAALVFNLQAFSAPLYDCQVTGVIEIQKKPFLSGKWKAKESRRTRLCLDPQTINLSISPNQEITCGHLSVQTYINASIIGNEDFEIKVAAVKRPRQTREAIFAENLIFAREIKAGEKIDEEASVEIVVSEQKKERQVLRTVRLNCSPK